jgi:hypothetical protein
MSEPAQWQKDKQGVEWVVTMLQSTAEILLSLMCGCELGVMMARRIRGG